MLEEWGAPAVIKVDVLMASQVIRKFGRPYQMYIHTVWTGVKL